MPAHYRQLLIMCVRLLQLRPLLLPSFYFYIYLIGYQHKSNRFAKQTFMSPKIALGEIKGDGGLDLPVTSPFSPLSPLHQPRSPASPFQARALRVK